MEISIVFAYWKDNIFQGYRADTFNTISKDHAKVYSYSKEQIDVVVNNVKGGCNRAWQSLLSTLTKGTSIMTEEGIMTDGNAVIEHVSKTDETFREWGEFELRVHLFPKEEWESCSGEGEEWKRKQILDNIPPAIETYKFQVLQNEN